jgi:hypothetical protein
VPITYSPTPININRSTPPSKKGTKMNSRIDVEIQIIKDELDELMEDPVLNRDRIKELKGDLEILNLQLEAEQLWNKQNIFDRD